MPRFEDDQFSYDFPDTPATKSTSETFEDGEYTYEFPKKGRVPAAVKPLYAGKEVGEEPEVPLPGLATATDPKTYTGLLEHASAASQKQVIAPTTPITPPQPEAPPKPTWNSGLTYQQKIDTNSLGRALSPDPVTQIPNEPIAKQGPLHPRRESLFLGKAPGETVETSTGAPQSLGEAVERNWQELPGVPETFPGERKVVKGATIGTANAAESFASPTNIALMAGIQLGMPAIAAKYGAPFAQKLSALISAKFAGDFAHGLMTDDMNVLGEAVETKDPQKIAEALTGIAVNGGMLADMAHGANRGAREAPGLEQVPATGADLRTMRAQSAAAAAAGADARAAAFPDQGGPLARGPFNVPDDIKAAAAAAAQGRPPAPTPEAVPPTSAGLPPGGAPPPPPAAGAAMEAPPAPFRAEREPNLPSPEHYAVQENFARWVEQNPKAAVSEYRTRFGNEVNADLAKELSPDYDLAHGATPDDRARFATAVQEPASQLAKMAYAEMLAEPVPEGKDDFVLFTAGGAGSGKSFALKNVPRLSPLKESANIIYDGTMGKHSSARARIDEALAAGRRVVYVFIDREPHAAYEGAIQRSFGGGRPDADGRMVPAEVHAAAHIGSREAFLSLQDHYRENPNVEFLAIDNNGKVEDIKEVDPSTIGVLKRGRKELEDEFREQARNAFREGRLSRAAYVQATGDSEIRESPEGRGEGNREGASGEPEAERGAGPRPPPEGTPEEVAPAPAPAEPSRAERIAALREQLRTQARQLGNDRLARTLQERIDSRKNPITDEELDDAAHAAAAEEHPPEIKPETHEIGDSPTREGLNERWEADRGAIPGEPMATLDGGKAAIIEIQDEKHPGRAVYEAFLDGGQSLGQFTSMEAAARRAEEYVDGRTSHAEPKQAAEPVRVRQGEPAGVAGEETARHGEEPRPGEGVSEPQPPEQGAEPPAGAAGGRAGRGAEDHAEVAGWTHSRPELDLRSRGGRVGPHDRWERGDFGDNDHATITHNPQPQIPGREYVLDMLGHSNASYPTLEEAMAAADQVVTNKRTELELRKKASEILGQPGAPKLATARAKYLEKNGLSSEDAKRMAGLAKAGVITPRKAEAPAPVTEEPAGTTVKEEAAHVAAREQARSVGAPSESTVEAGRTEALRAPEEAGEAPRGAAPSGDRGEEARSEPHSERSAPAGSAGGRGEEPPAVRPGTPGRTGEPGAAGEGKPRGGAANAGDEGLLSAGRGPEDHPEGGGSAGDFRFASAEAAEAAGAGSPRARVAANLQAVRLLKQLQEEGRVPTAEEQATLAKFSGWGSFPQMFTHYGDLADKAEELRALLGPDEYHRAEQSVLNAHYTSPRIVSAMWDMARRLGFKGGRVLEPSVGIGNFFALMPPDLRGRSRLTGVDIDTTTGSMAKLLYPNADVQVKGFQDLQVPDNFYDLAISNVPFGDYRVSDKAYNQFKANIHDYFFLRALDKVRPGGAVVFITSTGTLDKADGRIREALAERGADLVAAMRFPSETFQKNAGTAVVTDLVILKKRQPGEAPGGPAWGKTVSVPDPDGGDPIPVNEYYVQHPEMILGRLDRSGSMYRGDQVNVSRTGDFEDRFAKAMKALPENVIEPRRASKAFEPATIANEMKVRSGGYAVKDGKLYVSIGDLLVEKVAKPEEIARVGKMLDVRDAQRALYDAQLTGKDPRVTAEARAALTRTYDEFTKAHGPLHDAKNIAAIVDDPDASMLLALEKWDAKKKKASKADIFTKDTLRPEPPPDRASSAGDAVGISLKTRGALDIGHVARLLGKTEQEAGRELMEKGIAFDDPSEGWTPAPFYLSGNVRRKLAEAEAAAANDPRYRPNVEALRKVQPKDWDFTDIHAPLGAPWIDPKDYAQFMADVLKGQPEHFTAQHNSTTGKWIFRYTNEGARRHQREAAATQVWGTDRVDFMDLMAHAADGTRPIVRDKVDEKSVVNQAATDAANQKLDDVKAKWADWLWEDPERRQRLVRAYNDTNNNIVRTTYSADHYKDAEGNYRFPGMDPAFSLRDIQANAVWQAVSQGRALFGHEVGTGKTMTLVASAMESRRLGLAHKPIIVTPNAVIGGFAERARKLYPAARILVTGESLTGAQRKQTVAQIATGDWDMVLMTHDNLNGLPMRPETEAGFVQEELKALRAAKAAAEGEDEAAASASRWGRRQSKRSESALVKQLAKQEERLLARLKTLLEGQKEKDPIYFEDLGADMLLVDEAHKYKSLPVYTSQENLKGVPTSPSQRATNMLMRTRWLMDRNGGRGVIFATGTPIDNSLVELYNMQRYLQPHELKERGIETFDDWRRTFAEEVTTMEMKATGEYAPVTRLAKYVNVNDLENLASRFLDPQFADDVPGLVRPKRHDEVVTVPMSARGMAFLDTLRARAVALKKMTRFERREKGADNFLAIGTDARKAAMDMRLVDPKAPDEPGSKVNRCVAEVLKIYKEHPGKTQLIFSDFGVNEGKTGISIYRDITRKLVKGGIPREKIVDFSDLADKDRPGAIDRLKEGDALVGIGGTDKLGTGVNVQDKLYAVHHLDVPYTPARLEQRDGRIWRQGNTNPDIRIVRYATEGSFDTNMWQTVDRKSRFINQFMRGDFKSREFADEDGESLSYAQIMAITSGAPELLEKINLEEKVKNLERQARQHTKLQADYQDGLARETVRIKRNDEYIAAIEKDKATAAANPRPSEETPFRATIQGKEYTSAHEAGAALAEALADWQRTPSWRREDADVGTYRGFNIGFEGYEGAVLRKEARYAPQFSGDLERPESWFNSADGILQKLDARQRQAENDSARARESLETIRASMGQPFRGAGDLEAGKKRLVELEGIIAARAKEETERREKAGLPALEEAPDELAKSVTVDGEKPDPAAFYYQRGTEGNEEWKKAERVKRVDVPAAPDSEFFVHKNEAGWNFVEARSGRSIVHGMGSQIRAIAEGKAAVTRAGVDRLNELVNKAISRENGLSPRYVARGESAPVAAMQAPPVSEFRVAPKASAVPKPRPEPEPEAPPRPPKSALPTEKPAILAVPFAGKEKRLGQVIMRATLADVARRRDVEVHATSEWDRYFDKPGRMPALGRIEEIAQEWEGRGKKAEAKALREHAEQIDFIHRIEEGLPQRTPEKQQMADYLKEAWDRRKGEIAALGMEAAREWHLNYFPHIWEDPKGMKDVVARILGRRPMEGGKSFAKRRTFVTTMDGLEAGFIPVDWNPVRLSMLKMAEMDRYITAKRFLADLDRVGLKEFVRIGERPSEGWRIPQDTAFQVFKSPEIGVKEAYDAQLMDSLKAFADSLGVKMETRRSLGKRGRWGEALGDREVRRRFGGPEFVVSHEIGHVLDHRFKLYDKLTKADPEIEGELEKLAELRIGQEEKEGENAFNTAQYRNYIQTPDERTANLVHAFIHVPELAKQIAPKATAELRRIAENTPEMKPLLDIKPGLRMAENEGTVNAGGIVKTGGYAVPNEIADLLDRHLSPSLLAGVKPFEMYRKASQGLLMARLGWSGFHLGFTTGDATLSRLSLAGREASRGNLSGALEALGSVPRVFSGWVKDNPYLKEWYEPGTQGEDVAAIVRSLELGGARARQGGLHDLGAWEGFFRELRRAGLGTEGGKLARAGSILSHPGTLAATAARHPMKALAAAIEAGSRYILNDIVPRQKFAIAAQMAEAELRHLQAETGAKSLKAALDATNPERVKDIMGRVWDSIDNRLGQVVYDNLFLNRTVRDALHASVQSVGWNLGTIRELGGGVKDVGNLFKPETDVTGRALPRVTHRLAYTVMLPFFHAMLSGAIQYLYTGKGPEEARDLVFPKNGRTNPDGTAARLSPATYMKDVAAYLGGFIGAGGGIEHGFRQAATTVSHKVNPMLNELAEILKNEDFYGTEIRDRNAPLATQLAQLGEYVLKGYTPYAASGFLQERKTGASVGESLPSFIGLAPAAASVSRSPFAQALIEYRREHMPQGARSHFQAERSDIRRTLLKAKADNDTSGFEEAKAEALEKGLLSRAAISKLQRRSAKSAQVQALQSMPLPDAIRVYKLGDAEERELARPVIRKKIEHRSGLEGMPLKDRAAFIKSARALLENK